MKRWLVLAFVFLLTGATLNVAVAWGCLLWPKRDLSGPDPTIYGVDLAWWKSAAPADLNQPSWSSPERGLGYEIVSLVSPGPVTTLRGQQVKLSGNAAHIHAGLPMRTLYGEWFSIPDLTTAGGWRKRSRYAAYTGRPFLLDRISAGRLPYLPWLPLWPGFIVNTAVYAVLAWTPFAAVRYTQRWRRRRRGLCIACGYPIGASDVCSECGAATMKRALPRAA